MKKRVYNKVISLILLGGICLHGCETKPAISPAILTNADQATVATLTAALSQATHQKQIEFGAGGIIGTPTITVLPSKLGPLEIHSPNMPAVFDLYKKGAACVLIRRETGTEYPLPGVTCEAVE